jgi:hypothetical protein
MTMTG